MLNFPTIATDNLGNCYVSYFKEFESVNDIIEFECPEWKWYGVIYLPHEIKDRHFNITTGI